MTTFAVGDVVLAATPWPSRGPRINTHINTTPFRDAAVFLRAQCRLRGEPLIWLAPPNTPIPTITGDQS